MSYTFVTSFYLKKYNFLLPYNINFPNGMFIFLKRSIFIALLVSKKITVRKKQIFEDIFKKSNFSKFWNGGSRGIRNFG